MTWSPTTGGSRNYGWAWARVRAGVLKRDGHRCTIIDDSRRCEQRATAVDHIVPRSQGGSDDPDNLRSICGWHHNRITGRQASAARGQRATERRPAERHPGLR